MNLLKEFSKGDVQQNLKTSDQSDAGTTDTAAKAVDVKFSLMRNAINTDNNEITGSDVNDYLERAQDLNDEVESVGFAIETDDGSLIKIYVNAEQADAFSEELAKVLGLDDDAEVAINNLAQKYDIVDVVWPDSGDVNALGSGDEDEFQLDGPGEPGDNDGDVSIDDDLSDFMGGDDHAAEPTATDAASDETADALPADDESADGDVPPESGEDDGDLSKDDSDGDKADGDKPKKKPKKSLMKDVAGGDDAEDDKGEEEGGKPEGADGEEGGPETIDDGEDEGDADVDPDAEPDAGEESDELDDEGKPKKKSKKKDKEVTEEGMKLSKLESMAKALTEDQLDEAGGTDLKLDTQWTGLRSRLKRPYEKKIVELFSMLGVPGRYVVAEEGVEDLIRGAADVIRRPGRKQTTFNEFYSQVKASTATTNEKKRGGRLQKVLETVMIELGFPASLVSTESGPGALGTVLGRAANKIEASQSLESALIAFAKAMGITSAQVNEAKTIKVKEPGWYVVDHMDKAVAGPMQERGAHELCDEMNAGKTGGDIKAFDVTYFTDYEIRRMNEAVVTEAVDVGNDEFFQKVVQLAVSLGIPERNLQYGRPALVKSLRDKKMSLSNRGMIEARVDQLLAIIEKATRQAPATAQATNEGMLAEAFDALEAIPQEMYQRFNVQEPSTGPVMMAGYVGDTDAHSETVLVLGVDPEAEGRNTLRVGVDNPWSGSVQSKYFPDTREGYRDALRYAKMLRTLNLKTGGRPAEVK